MNRRFALLALLMAVAVTFAVVPMSMADTLTPGSTVTFSSPNIFPGSFTLVTSSGPVSVTSGAGSAAWTGTVTSVVVEDNSTGFLDFLYQFHNNGPDTIADISVTSFAGFTTDVGYKTSAGPGSLVAGNVGPNSAFRGTTGDVVHFTFGAIGSPTVVTGDTTYSLEVNTNATTYQAGVLGIIDGGTTNTTTFVPGPEPGSMLLFGTGLSGVAAMLRRRATKQ